jgi:hypothetical protein
LAISDFDADGLAQTEKLIQKIGADVRADRLDVTERAALLAYADTVNAHFGTVNRSTTLPASRSWATLKSVSSRTLNA